MQEVLIPFEMGKLSTEGLSTCPRSHAGKAEKTQELWLHRGSQHDNPRRKVMESTTIRNLALDLPCLPQMGVYSHWGQGARPEDEPQSPCESRRELGVLWKRKRTWLRGLLWGLEQSLLRSSKYPQTVIPGRGGETEPKWAKQVIQSHKSISGAAHM